VSHDGRALAIKLQYPDMASAVEADLSQLGMLFALHRQFDPAVDTREIAKEISERIREELDYRREAKHAALYTEMLADVAMVRVPETIPELSTNRLLAMTWLQGDKLLSFKEHDLETRNRLATAMFKAWWLPFSRFGVIHGDPHLGNYSVFSEGGEAQGINLLDYGCVRIFPPRFVGGVVDLYQGLLHDDQERVVHAYETWGFKNLRKDLVEVLNVWARFIYGPLLDDRVRTIANGVAPGAYGRQEAFTVHKALKEKGPVTIPREFVFMDRAAIGLGGVFLHLNAELNFFKLFNEAIADFSTEIVAEKQTQLMDKTGLAKH
jgi:predicted unusual protein kinase regulating ubiquinone biosynthesis (AarF/ABC1/UbiB family)